MGRDSMGLLGVLTGGNDPYTNGERERRREARERSQERFSEFFGGLGDAAEEDPSLLGHFGLDLVGLVPGWGAFADLANAAWYAAEGDYESAARSAVYAIPVVGDIVAVVDMAEAGVELLSDPDVVQAIIESIDSASVPMSASSAVGKLATKLKGLAKKGGKGAKKAGKVGKQGGTVIVNGNGPCGGAKRGPKPRGNGPHNTTVDGRIAELKTELGRNWTHEHGGQKVEQFIDIKAGFKTARRPDISFYNNRTGEWYFEQVGLFESIGRPMSRERKAILDIFRQTGLLPVFTPYVR